MVDSSNPQELQAKLQELLADEAFAKELLSMEKYEDVQDALEERGVELSLDEIRRLAENVQKAQSGEMDDGELSEDELGEVAGGSTIGWLVIRW